MPLASPVKRVLPPRLKEALRKKFLTQRIQEKPRFSEVIRRQAVAAVRGDAERFLQYAGRPRDFWKFE